MNRMDNYIILNGKKVELSEETVKNLLKSQKEPIILVPDNIQFSESGNNYSMGLGFGNNQELFWHYSDKMWKVAKFCCLTKTKLVSCEYEDLEVGDWYLGRDYKDYKGNYKQKEYYFLKGVTRNWFVDENCEVRCGAKGWFYYWKVVEVE